MSVRFVVPGRPVPKGPWTETELEFLRRNQQDLNDAARQLGRSRASVAGRASKHTPDFRVTLPNGRVEYHEVKGYMDPKSRTALRRMERYYPAAKVIIDGHTYKDLRRKLGRVIPGWEDPPPEPVWTPEQDALVRGLWSAGIHAEEIARRLGKTAVAVSIRAQRLGARRPSRDVGNWHPGRGGRKMSGPLGRRS